MRHSGETEVSWNVAGECRFVAARIVLGSNQTGALKGYLERHCDEEKRGEIHCEELPWGGSSRGIQEDLGKRSARLKGKPFREALSESKRHLTLRDLKETLEATYRPLTSGTYHCVIQLYLISLCNVPTDAKVPPFRCLHLLYKTIYLISNPDGSFIKLRE